MRPRWPLPIGLTRSMIRAVGEPELIRAQALLRVQGCHVGEVGALSPAGSSAVDGVDAGRRASFSPRPAWRGAGGALDVVALAQPVLPDLGDGQGDVSQDSARSQNGGKLCCRRHARRCPTP